MFVDNILWDLSYCVCFLFTRVYEKFFLDIELETYEEGYHNLDGLTTPL